MYVLGEQKERERERERVEESSGKSYWLLRGWRTSFRLNRMKLGETVRVEYGRN